VPKQNAHIAHFHVGEFSDAGLARADLEITPLAAETQENLFPHSIGYGQVRPGLKYLGATSGNNQARLIPFVRSIDDVALLELTSALLRVWVDDELVTRPTVNCSIPSASGNFTSSSGWTLSASSGASSSIGSGVLQMHANARGSSAYCERLVSTTSYGTEHALRIIVLTGPVLFRCGSTSGGQDYIAETSLDAGWHSLSFTPNSNFYVRFITRNPRLCAVDSIEIETAGVMSVPAPWTTSQLRSFRYDQSADIIFLANRNLQQLKIERRNPRSWSVVYYYADDGPFQGTPVEGASLTPGSTFGNTTITSDKPVFESTMVGSLIRLYHDRLDASWQLAGDGTYTDIFAVRGVKGEDFNDRQFSYQITGTWSGTLRVQRSLTGEDGDFLDYNRDDGSSTTTITGNISVTHAGEAEDNNVISYTRIGFIDGAYTSGSATVSVQYEGSSGYGVGRITGVNSATSVSVEVLENFNATTGTKSWEIGSWSAYNGWPSAVSLYDGRLWWGGLDNVWGSASDAYYSFDDLETTDASTIQRQIATGGQVSRIAWFLPLQRLIIGTAGSEVSMRASDVDGFLTPGGVTLKDASTFGSANVQPTRLDSRGMFTHRSGLRVIAIGYSFEDNDYRSADLCELNEDICESGVVEMAIQREPETYVWCVRDDGQCAILIYDQEDKDNRIQGWSRFITDGEVESVAVLPEDSEDAVYMAVNRSDYGQSVEVASWLGQYVGVGASGYIALGFTDQSARISDTVTPANNLVSQGQLDEWGRPQGPDAVLLHYWRTDSFGPSDAVFPRTFRRPGGYWRYNYHNLMAYSEQLSSHLSGSFQYQAVTLSDDVAVAPNGETIADKIVEDSTLAHHYCLFRMYGFPTIGTRRNIYSICMKAGEFDEVNLGLVNGTPNDWSGDELWEVTTDTTIVEYRVELNNGDAAIDTQISNGSSVTVNQIWDEDLGDGWRRYYIDFTSTGLIYMSVRLNDGSLIEPFKFQGLGTRGVYVWGWFSCAANTGDYGATVPDYARDYRYVYNPDNRHRALLNYEYDENLTTKTKGIRIRPYKAARTIGQYLYNAVYYNQVWTYDQTTSIFGEMTGCKLTVQDTETFFPNYIVRHPLSYYRADPTYEPDLSDRAYAMMLVKFGNTVEVSFSLLDTFPSPTDEFQLINYTAVGTSYAAVRQEGSAFSNGFGSFDPLTDGFRNLEHGMYDYGNNWWLCWASWDFYEPVFATSQTLSFSVIAGNLQAPAPITRDPLESDDGKYCYAAYYYGGPPLVTDAVNPLPDMSVTQYNHTDAFGFNFDDKPYSTSQMSFYIKQETNYYYENPEIDVTDDTNIGAYWAYDQFGSALGDLGDYYIVGLDPDGTLCGLRAVDPSDDTTYRIEASTIETDAERAIAYTAEAASHILYYNGVSVGSSSAAVLPNDYPLVSPQFKLLNPTYAATLGSGPDFWLKELLISTDVLTSSAIETMSTTQPSVPALRYIEKLSKHSAAIGGTANEMCDAWLYAAGPVSSVTAAHLFDRTNLVAWVTQNGTQYALTGLSADGDGVVALGDTYTDVYVGIAYTAKYKSSKLVYGAPPGGVSLMQPKRVGELGLLLENTHRDAVSFGGDFDTMRKMSLVSGGKSVAANSIYTVHDQVGFSFPGYWNTDSRVCLKVEAPYPATFLGLVISVEENERGIKPRRR